MYESDAMFEFNNQVMPGHRKPSHNKLVNSGGHTPRHAPVAVKYRDHSLSTIRPARKNGTTQSSCAGAAFHYETSLVDSLI